MKGFIHIFEVDEKTEKRFKEFAENVTCNRYNFAITYLLDFHETFRDVIKTLVNKEKLTIVKQDTR